MGGSSRPSESFKTNEQSLEKKKGFADWMNLIKPANEEKDHWVISFLFEGNVSPPIYCHIAVFIRALLLIRVLLVLGPR